MSYTPLQAPKKKKKETKLERKVTGLAKKVDSIEKLLQKVLAAVKAKAQPWSGSWKFGSAIPWNILFGTCLRGAWECARVEYVPIV